MTAKTRYFQKVSKINIKIQHTIYILIKINPADVNLDIYVNFSIDSDIKNPKHKDCHHIGISNYKNILSGV